MKKAHAEIKTKLNAINAVLKHGQSVAQVAKTINVHRDTIYQWLHQHKNSKSLSRRYNPKSGRQSKILGEDFNKIVKIIKKSAIKFGYDTDFWTTRRIAQVIKKELGIGISKMGVFRALKKIRYSYKLPETRYYKPDPKKQKEWLLITVPKIQALIKRHNAIAYFEDEANVSLTPVIAKSWGPIGKKVIKITSGNRGSISIISAVSKDGRFLFNVHDKNKRYKAIDIIRFLSQILIHHPRRHIVVIMDQAPCHKAKSVKTYLKTQKRLHVFYLPPRSPEFNPDEKIWHYIKTNTLKSHNETNTKGLKKLVTKKLTNLKRNKDLTRKIYKISEGAFF